MILLCDADDEVDEPWLAAMVEALTPGYWVGGVLGYEKLNSPRTRRFWDVASYSMFRPTDPYVDDTKGGNCGFYRSIGPGWTGSTSASGAEVVTRTSSSCVLTTRGTGRST